MQLSHIKSIVNLSEQALSNLDCDLIINNKLKKLNIKNEAQMPVDLDDKTVVYVGITGDHSTQTILSVLVLSGDKSFELLWTELTAVDFDDHLNILAMVRAIVQRH